MIETFALFGFLWPRDCDISHFILLLLGTRVRRIWPVSIVPCFGHIQTPIYGFSLGNVPFSLVPICTSTTDWLQLRQGCHYLGSSLRSWQILKPSIAWFALYPQPSLRHDPSRLLLLWFLRLGTLIPDAHVAQWPLDIFHRDTMWLDFQVSI